MAADTKTPEPPADPKAKFDPKTEGKPKEKERVVVVTADGPVEATVTAAHGDRADLSFDYRGEPTTITGSPFDPTGKLSDSWHRG